MSAKGLGKSFGSLLPENFDSSVMLDKGERIQKISVSSIKADPDQPRKSFDSAAIEELAGSIKRYGILQPLVITKQGDGYSIIAGERRFRAAKIAGLTQVPALVRTMEDIERLEVGLIENMQRVDLSPMEQAVSIARLNEQFSIPLTDIAKRLGKAHTTIVNTVRLLQLPDFARKALEKGYMSEGHARAVLSLKADPSAQKFLTSAIEKEGWSVRQAEAYVQKQKNTGKLSGPVIGKQTKLFAGDEKKLHESYGAKIKITPRKSGISVQFNFKSNKDYTQFIDKITD